MTYKYLFFISFTFNTAFLVSTWSDNSSKIIEEIREVERCKICSNMAIKDLKSAREELHLASLQLWYKKQIDRRNGVINSAILNGEWASGAHVPEILTPPERQLPAFQALFKQTDTPGK